MSSWGKEGYWDDQGRWVNGEGSTGFAFGGSDAGTPDNPNKHGLKNIPNSEWNQIEAKRLADSAFAWKPTASAVHAAPVTIDRSAENATNAMQMAQLARMQQSALGKGPSVANALGQGAYDATLKAQMGAGKGGGALGLRGIVGAGSAMQGDNAAKFAAMRAGEQQGAYGALAGAAFGARGASLAGDIDQAKINQQLAMTNAGADQAVALANQRAQMQAFGNQLGAAQTYGNLVQDAFGADLGYRRFLTEGERIARERRDRADQRDQAQAAQGVGAGATLLTMGAYSGSNKPPKAQG